MNQGSTLNVHEAAQTLKVHENTILKLIESGAIPAAKIGRAYVMLTKDVMAYAETMIVQQTAARMRRSPKSCGKRLPSEVRVTRQHLDTAVA